MKKIKVLVLGIVAIVFTVASCVPAIASPGGAKAKQTSISKIDSLKSHSLFVTSADHLFDLPVQVPQVTLYRSDYFLPVARVENTLILPYYLVRKRNYPPNLFYERNWLSKQRT